MPTASNKSGRRWPWVIGGIYVLFMIAMLVVLAWSTTQRVDLVTPDYYAKTLTYEQQIERMNNAAALSSVPTIEIRQSMLTLTMPDEARDGKAKGNVTLFRPSNAQIDVTVPLSCDAQGRQYLPVEGLPRGLWRIKIAWQDAEKEYYFEEAVNL